MVTDDEKETKIILCSKTQLNMFCSILVMVVLGYLYIILIIKTMKPNINRSQEEKQTILNQLTNTIFNEMNVYKTDATRIEAKLIAKAIQERYHIVLGT